MATHDHDQHELEKHNRDKLEELDRLTEETLKKLITIYRKASRNKKDGVATMSTGSSSSDIVRPCERLWLWTQQRVNNDRPIKELFRPACQ